ncbi:ABC transporter permease [Microcella alkalica]|uniref:Peptide/nickel transport system permease protein n=1 Tax=Microcella alkalica TaxID=355930 RepID=A0A839E6Z2_9MICO|nr:ABC transporter permease [Microcella alkalica]MBA8848251.1 peptide/nickel transport system permease protein [Microcella alkalica]
MQVRDYLLRRLALLPLIMLGVSIVVFTLTRFTGSPVGIYASPNMTPDQVAALEARYLLDEPIPVQYIAWLGGLFRGDFGWSGVSVAPVTDVIWVKIAATLELALAAGAIAIFVGIAIGTIAGVRQNKWPDHSARLFSILGASTPTFWFGLLLLVPFYLWLNWFPLGRATPDIYDSVTHLTGMYTLDALLNANPVAFVDALRHIVLPATVLAFGAMATIVRMMRSSMVETMSEEYVDAARAKGLPESVVVKRHARRNALVPTSTVIGLSFGFLLQGAVAVELIFRWPGLGQWVSSAILAGDQATIMAYVLVTAFIFMTVNLAVDVAYAYLDRRVVLGG